ncbi:polyprenyl synthetase family protein [Arcanobacterium haemolyticum]|nr:polyprenyl synthetase family protein [Arcanobacterium haemolyticum]
MERVERQLEGETWVGDSRLDHATSHLAQAGGKRLRPVLVLLCAELGPRPEAQEVFDSAVAVELTHLASLYHDDVMDDASTRRGVPAAQHVFGNTVAILSGDVLFARASRIVAGLGPRAVALHATTFERLCSGELHETMGRLEEQTPRDHYISVLADKTGALIAASARYGVISAGASEELAERMAEFGERVGVAFQLADDVIDVMSDGDVTGKTPGTDMREGVDTMPVILLREQREAGTIDAAGEEILTLVDDADLSSDDELNHLVALLREHPVMELTRAMAQEWVDAGIELLDVVDDDEIREGLVDFARQAVDRAS